MSSCIGRWGKEDCTQTLSKLGIGSGIKIKAIRKGGIATVEEVLSGKEITKIKCEEI
jgi:hypothetical protein